MIFNRPHLPNPSLENRSQIRKVDDDLFRYLNELDESLISMFIRGLNFDDNFDSCFVDYVSHVTANTQSTVAHTLGRTPTGYIPVTKNKAADVYNTTAPDENNLYLKCSVSSATIKLLVI